MEKTSLSKQYTLTLEGGVSSAEISLQEYSTAKLKYKNGHAVSSIKADQSNNNVVFSIEGGEYNNAVAHSTCTYKGKKTSSQCNICFILTADSPFVWQATGKRGQGDNSSMFPAGTGSNATEHKRPKITIQTITEENPVVPPSSAQVLRPSQVFLVDWDAKNKNILVRGNSPLGPESKGGQTINFPNLQAAIVSACKAASGPTLSDLGDYVLHDIALLSSAEEYIWANEYFSFSGNTGTPKDTKETWLPGSPTPLRGITSCSPTGQMARWNVEPVDAKNDGIDPTALVRLVKNLKTWMNTENSVYHIYYIHCASGHDRTGMVSATYLAYKGLTSANSQGSVSAQIDSAFIDGTTLQYQESGSGGDIVQKCYDFRTSVLNIKKSRCFLASSSYNNTFLTALEILVPPSQGTYSLGSDTTRTPSDQKEAAVRPYVMPSYPFIFIAQGYATMEAGVVLKVNILVPGSGYSSAPTVTIEPPNDGMTAKAVATIENGSVVGATMTDQGSGYDFSPQVTFSSP